MEVAQPAYGSVDQGVAEPGSFQIEKPDASVAIEGIAGGSITVGKPVEGTWLHQKLSHGRQFLPRSAGKEYPGRLGHIGEGVKVDREPVYAVT
jgi:hypothetical protein